MVRSWSPPVAERVAQRRWSVVTGSYLIDPVGAGVAWIQMETDGSCGTRIGIDSNGHERICPEVHGTVIMSRGVVQFLNGTAVERAELVVQRG